MGILRRCVLIGRVKGGLRWFLSRYWLCLEEERGCEY